MDKVAELKKLEREIAARRDLPLMKSNLVFGEGRPDCDVMFVGEAPGANEDKERRPFVGCCGKLLLESIPWTRGQVYISNIVMRRPPDNRRPNQNEIKAYGHYLKRQIEIINPKVVCTLGRFSMDYFSLPEKRKLLDKHGEAFKAGDRLIYPVYHPGAALRSTAKKSIFKEDLKKLPAIVAQAHR
jgi:DNA polymerase